MTVQTGLTRTLERAGIPIDGVSFGSLTDRATWTIHFKANATDTQKAAAAALVTSYDASTDAALKDELAEKDLAFKALASLARVTWEHLPLVGRPTWAAFLARWKAIYLANS